MMLNATISTYFLLTMGAMFKRIYREPFKVWAEDVIILGKTQAEMVENLVQVMSPTDILSAVLG